MINVDEIPEKQRAMVFLLLAVMHATKPSINDLLRKEKEKTSTMTMTSAANKTLIYELNIQLAKLLPLLMAVEKRAKLIKDVHAAYRGEGFPKEQVIPDLDEPLTPVEKTLVTSLEWLPNTYQLIHDISRCANNM